MKENKINVADLAEHLIDRMDEHDINPYDQAAALSIAYLNSCKRVKMSRGGAIDVLISTYEAYDDCDP